MKSEFREKLLKWNRSVNKREMPWKGETDPYKIWLSEIILQQTRVQQGLRYYEAFIKNFPTVNDLANARDEKVFKLWEGLGYYSRCKNLLATARFISTKLGGKFPATYDDIRQLKGIGPYTAAAIASFAFNLPHAVVDGNVQRVISRYFGVNTPIDTTQGKKFYQQVATELLDDKSPAAYNQAIMDFGAIICKPRNPECPDCPQKNECEALAHGLIEQLPVKEKKLVRKQRWFHYFIISSPEAIFVRKRTASDIWQNLHEFVLDESSEAGGPPADTRLKRILGKQPFTIISQSRVYVQHLTHQTIHGQFIEVEVGKNTLPPEDYQPVPKDEISHLAFPRLINSFLDEKQS